MNKKNVFLIVVILVVLLGIVLYDSYLIFDKKEKKGEENKNDVVVISSYEQKFKQADVALKNAEIEAFLNSTNAASSGEDFLGTLFDRQDNLENFKLSYTLFSFLKNENKEHVFLIKKETLEEVIGTIFADFSFSKVPSSFSLNYEGNVGNIICEEKQCMIFYESKNTKEDVIHYYTKVVDTKTSKTEKVYSVLMVYVDYEYTTSETIARTILKADSASEEVLYEGSGLLPIESFDDVLNYISEDALRTYEFHFTLDNRFQYSKLVEVESEE